MMLLYSKDSITRISDQIIYVDYGDISAIKKKLVCTGSK